MNFVIEKKILYQSLQKIVNIVVSRPRMPILSHVLLEINKNFLFMTATDLEIEIIVKVCLNDVYANSCSTVSARKFFNICRGFSDCSKIFITLKGDKLVINSGSSNFRLSTFSTSDFPKLESWNDVVELKISQIVLKKIIELTQFSMGHQDVRYYLNGIFFEIKEKIVRIVATDGHRLAMCSVSINTSLSLLCTAIIPRKGICEILRLLSIEKESSLVNIYINKHSICMKINNYTITSKLIDAVFPAYNNVFIEKSKNILEVECDNLRQALKRAAIISNERSCNVQFILINNILKIIAHNFENEMLEETLSVVYTGQNMEISFNINYLLDVLNVMNTKLVKFLFTDASSSVQIEGITKYYNETYIVMPIRI